ncbi:hypothetical protein P4O66_020236 [Electrophorus voltai]|uniref:Uncharacterized protein n=1 Tax=Electrophorus voltai TaxID=2609070 RepID=A0AAD9E4K3_9TELE|nr:hypothetical protein P4O66_020236 [Electrophorus voltai]
MAELKVLYEKQGYLTSIPILNSKELQQARDAFTKLERKFGEHYTSYNLHNVHMEYDWVRALTKHPKVLEVITTVLGPDILLLDSQFICKYPVFGTNLCISLLHMVIGIGHSMEGQLGLSGLPWMTLLRTIVPCRSFQELTSLAFCHIGKPSVLVTCFLSIKRFQRSWCRKRRLCSAPYWLGRCLILNDPAVSLLLSWLVEMTSTTTSPSKVQKCE